MYYNKDNKEREAFEMNYEEMYDCLHDIVGVSEEALDLAFSIGGCSEKTGERILFYYTGCHNFENFFELT